MSHIFLYGPPGSGKTSVGKALAEKLEMPFMDLDASIEAVAGNTIPEIMEKQGESGFRDLESAVFREVVTAEKESVIGLGGGALLRVENRLLASQLGKIVLLETNSDVLLERLSHQVDQRPLLKGDLKAKLMALLASRKDHYASFALRVVNNDCSLDCVVMNIQRKLGLFHIRRDSISYNACVQYGGLEDLVSGLMRWKDVDAFAVVTDSNVGPLYTEKVRNALSQASRPVHVIPIMAGEANKTLNTVSTLWNSFLEAGLGRKSLVVALGGGVTGDLAGFAASTFMRGVAWAGIPTSLLSMVDASIGGKTGFDLPTGKNLVGTFHSPREVLVDPELLETLPEEEFRSGLAEVVKAGVVGDPHLFRLCSNGIASVRKNIEEVVSRSLAVKVDVINIDPMEQGLREVLNFGHTIGHAVELVSGFKIRHGEAVSIGMVAEASLAEKVGLAGKGLSSELRQNLDALGLPTAIPSEFSMHKMLQVMGADKKKKAGKIRFALPLSIGEVKPGIEIEDLDKVFLEL